MRASASRASLALNTTQVTSMEGSASASVMTVPLHPISRSSQCAPRHSTRVRGRSRPSSRTLRTGRAALPHGPRCIRPGVHVVECLLVLERIHRRPEPLIAIPSQPSESDQSLERLLDEFFAVLHGVEDLTLEHEEPAIDQNSGIADVANVPDPVSLTERHDVEALAGADAEEAGDGVLAAKMGDVFIEGKIG